MSLFTAFEARSWVGGVLRGATTTARKFDFDLLPHEVAFMILSNALFRSLTSIEFLKRRFFQIN